MRVLAVETATTATAVALDDGHGHLDEVVADESRHHTESLAPAAVGLLAARGLEPAELDEVVVDVGPGLFTGLRVGIAFAKGLSLAAGAQLRTVTAADVLAAAAAAQGVTGEVVAVVDARRGEVFAARYELDSAAPRRLDALRVLSPLALRAELDGRPATLVGDGARRYADVFGAETLADVVVPPPSVALGLAALQRAAGEPPVPPDELVPLYLREPDAVANFSVRGGPPR